MEVGGTSEKRLRGIELASCQGGGGAATLAASTKEDNLGRCQPSPPFVYSLIKRRTRLEKFELLFSFLFCFFSCKDFV